ncbi:hypothetical protein BH10BDE1_BH10BDE1_03580 [soil metagenome]
MKSAAEIFSKMNIKKTAIVFVFLAVLGAFAYTQLNVAKDGAHASAGDVVAVVESVERDVRQRPVEEASWYRAEAHAEIQRGDAVYSGAQSRSRVKMKSGGVLELGEETLVIFDDVDGVTVPDVSRGQVKIKINGQMKIAISGEVAEFTGAQSELVLNSNGGVRNVKVVAGEASIRASGASKRAIRAGETFELAKVLKKSSSAKVEAPLVGESVSPNLISLRRKIVALDEGDRKTAAETAPAALTDASPVALAAPVPEPAAEPVAETGIVSAPPVPEVAAMETAPMVAATAVVKEALSPVEPSLNVQRVMKVQEVYQRKGSALLVPRTGLKFLKTPVALAWNGAVPEEKIFLQLSKEASFKNTWLEREATGTNVVIDQWKTGKSFWRVSRDGQSWSSSGEVTVKPQVSISQAPSVKALKNKVSVFAKGKGPEAQAKLLFEDSGLKKVRGWVLQGSSSALFPAGTSKTVFVSKDRIDVPLHRPGHYFFRVRSVASEGEISTYSTAIEVQALNAAAAPVPLRMAKRRAPKQREIAAVEPELKADTSLNESPLDDVYQPKAETRTRANLKTLVEKDPNRARPWQVTIEGGESALVSSEQIGASDAADIHVLGLHGGYDDGKNSGHFGYRGQLGGGNGEGSAQASSKFEARYTRWWQMPWQPLRLGWLGGFDRYRNDGSVRFSKGYDSAKTGLDVGISFSEKWKGGGNILVGGWTDSNRVYELGGFLSYDLSREIAFGLGYRVSLFEAGTAASAPIALPYREALGEVYSALQFSF